MTPVFWRVASDSLLYLSAPRPDVSISWALPQALASSGILLPSHIRLALPLRVTSLAEGDWGLLRSPSLLLEPLGRRYPPGFSTVPTGQSDGCQCLAVAVLAPAPQPLALVYNHDGSSTSLLSLPIGSCEASDPGEAPRVSPFIPASTP